ncbi:zinc finger and BTB domain-containing protein 41 [Dendroctonus ponderosae]|uniref:zinc finger and BTB domain-containing protein 41 n=1 Tax=Dendroctonus ponderosae TaxID=77166 RepID=UPI00203535D8|nr:zinc finger and BTB domain-containing protein 41 [Dendroctonus ponderosae]KAH1003059.1 hypothetical protein HUJ05_011005 [Dendroctonus ponderosae]
MGTAAVLNERSTVCRTCLRVLDKSGFTYMDDASAYVENVGNIREMVQFCVPELDLYVSSSPVICYQCLPILVQVYNFKIRCLNGENVIKSYINRNNLQEYNHVNLNCVLMDDLKMKSEKIQIESRIKHMMLDGAEELDASSNEETELEEEDQLQPAESLKVEADELDTDEEPLETVEDKEERPVKVVAVRKDLFEAPQSELVSDVEVVKQERSDTPTEPPAANQAIATPKIVSVASVADQPEPTYSCNKCSYVTSDVIEMYDHNRSCHEFDYTCQFCPFSTSKVELLGKHMSMVHPENMQLKRNAQFKVTENYACSLCPFSVKSLDLLRSHHLSAHGNTEGMKGPIVLNHAFGEEFARKEPRILKRLEYTCDMCAYTTKDKSNLRKHLFTHGTKPLKCQYCSYKCVSPYQLRRHQKQKHAKHMDARPRNQPYALPDFVKDKDETMDKFKITLETIKREIEKELKT